MQGARTALNGQRGNQTMTLAIGFGEDASAARTAAAGSLAGGFAAAETSFKADWAQYRGTLDDPPESVATGELRRVYEQSLLVLAASEDKTYRGASIAAPNMAWIWGTLTLEPEPKQRSGPYHLVWPRDLFHVATAQKAAGDDAAAERLLDYLWNVQKERRLVVAEHVRLGHREVDGRADGPGVASDRARLVAGPHERSGLVARRAGRGLRGRERPGERQRALGEPGRLLPQHDRDGDRRADLRGRHRGRERPSRTRRGPTGEGRRVAAEGGVLDRDEYRPLLTARRITCA